MRKDVAQSIQAVVGVVAVVVVTVTALFVVPDPDNTTLTILTMAFTAIAALLGVHYSVSWVNGGLKAGPRKKAGDGDGDDER
jgi:hypothetical protein